MLINKKNVKKAKTETKTEKQKYYWISLKLAAASCPY
jgi:hypothetical protein